MAENNDYIRGDAMGATNEQLSSLHDFAESYRDRKRLEKEEAERDLQEKYKNNRNFIDNFVEMYTKKYDAIDELVDYKQTIDLENGKFMLMHKNGKLLTICITTNADFNITNLDWFDNVDNVEIVQKVSFGDNAIDRIYFWSNSDLEKANETKRSYTGATLNFTIEQISQMSNEELDLFMNKGKDLITLPSLKSN